MRRNCSGDRSGLYSRMRRADLWRRSGWETVCVTPKSAKGSRGQSSRFSGSVTSLMKLVLGLLLFERHSTPRLSLGRVGSSDWFAILIEKFDADFSIRFRHHLQLAVLEPI